MSKFSLFIGLRFFLLCSACLNLLGQDAATTQPTNKTLLEMQKTSKNLSEKLKSSDFGRAVITYIRNNTAYPIALDAEKNLGTGLIDQISSSSVVRIKSLKNEFGEGGRYFSLQDFDGLKVLKTAENKDTKPAELLVKKYKNAANGKTFLGFCLPETPENFLITTPSNQVQFSNVPGGFNSDESLPAQWFLSGTRLENCFLINNLKKGVFGPTDAKNVSPADFPPKKNIISLGQAKGASGSVVTEVLASGLVQKNELAFDALVWRANRARQNWLKSSLSDAQAKKTSVEYIQAAQMVREQTSKESSQEPIKYGDRIKLMHVKTLQNIYTTLEKSDVANAALVACANDDTDEQMPDDLGAWWIIKGPHYTANDRWNCVLGSPVKIGDVIRLENVKTQQNLSAVTEKNLLKPTLAPEVLPKNYDFMSVVCVGKDGVSSMDDNWILLAEEGSADFLHTNRKINLQHALTEQKLITLESFIVPGSLPPNQLQQMFVLKRSASFEKGAADSNIFLEGKDWFVSQAVGMQAPKDNVAWTGFENGAVFEDTPNNRIAIEVIKSGAVPVIEAGQTLEQQFDVDSDKPTLAGFASEKIDNVATDTLIVLSPLLSKGIAWLNKPADTPGSFAVAFLARTQEEGTIEVFLGESVGLEWLYKLVLGSNSGRETKLFKRVFKDGKFIEQEVFTVNKSENRLAGINPGNFLPYWVSFYQNNLSMGFGLTPGKNIIVSWQEQDQIRQPFRIGFGSFKVSSEYTGIKFTNPVKIISPAQEFTLSDSFSLAEGQQKWLEKPLRIPGIGTINFALEGSGELILILAQSTEPGSQQYSLRLNSDEKKIEVLEWDSNQGKYKKTLETAALDDFMTSVARKPIWVSFDDEQIFVGSGERFESLKLVRPKNLALSKFLRVGFLSKRGNFKVSGLRLSSPVKLESVEISSQESDDWTGLLKKDSMFLIAPFDYLLDQDGPSIRFKDRIANTTQFLGKAVAQDTRYEFILAIGNDGLPTVNWTREPENAGKIIKRILGKALQGAGQSLYLAASYIESTGNTDKKLDVDEKGVLGIAPIKAAASSLATTALGLSLATSGIVLEKETQFSGEKGLQTAKEAKKPRAIKSDQSFVYEETQSLKSRLEEESVPREALQNRLRLEDQILAGQKWIASDPDKLVQLISLYKQAIGLISHPYVIKNPNTKDSLVENLETLYQAHEEFFGSNPKVDPSYAAIFNLLFFANSNSYLIDSSQTKDLSWRKVLLARMSGLASKMLQGDGWIELPALSDVLIWLEKKLPEPSKAQINFAVKGQNDFIVTLAQDVADVQTEVQGYKVVFGGENNQEIQICVAGFSTPVASVKIEKGVLSSLDTRSFWIKVVGSKISVGRNASGAEEAAILEWTDPYPLGEVSQVGLSSRNSSIRVEKFEIIENKS